MAVRISTSKFLSSTVAQAEAKKDLDAPLPQGGGPLPAGIKGGVARLLSIYFDEDDKTGESFRAEAEVELPVTYAGQYIKGKKTKQWITFNAENLSERIPRIRDIIKYLGGREIFGDGRNIDFIKIVEFLEKSNKTKPIYFGFSTSQKDNSEWPWENWYPAIKGFVPPSANNAPETQSQKKSDSSVNGYMTVIPTGYTAGSERTVMVNTNTAPWSARSAEVDHSVKPTSNEYTDTDDVDSLIQRAMTKEDMAMDKMDEFAKALGYDQKDLDDADSYAVIGGWVKGGKMKPVDTHTEVNDDGEVVESKPKRVISVNQVYQYEPAGKREGQRLKARECRVTAVSGDKITLQNLANKVEVYETIVSDEFLK